MPRLRKTQQREAIRQGFIEARRPLSPPEVLEAARGQLPGLGMATVYRAIKDLVDEAFLVPVDVPGQPTRYELAGLEHHHHFRCRQCDRVFDIPGCAYRLRRLAPRGFTLEAHDIWLFGLCRRCSAPSA